MATSLKAEKPTEHKTVQARILAYAQEIGWTYVPRGEAENRRGFDHSKPTPAEQAAAASPYFDDLLDAQVRKFNPKYAEGPGALVGDHPLARPTAYAPLVFLARMERAFFRWCLRKGWFIPEVLAGERPP